MKNSLYDDILKLGEDNKNDTFDDSNIIEKSVSNYLFNSTTLNKFLLYIQDYINIIRKESKYLKIIYNYTEKINTNRINY